MAGDIVFVSQAAGNGAAMFCKNICIFFKTKIIQSIDKNMKSMMDRVSLLLTKSTSGQY